MLLSELVTFAVAWLLDALITSRMVREALAPLLELLAPSVLSVM